MKNFKVILSVLGGFLLVPLLTSTCVGVSSEELAVVSRAYAADDGPGGEDEECPAGYEESEEKCTPEEREEGCKDVRLDNGKGCVKR